jgi:hypothetical protein
MNLRQEKFVREYLATGNASEAARRAGYAKKSAGVHGDKLLKKAEICAELEKARKQTAGKACRTREEWLAGIDRLCRHKNPMIALKAHEQLGKAQGYNEPDKQRIEMDSPLVIVHAPPAPK